MKRILFIFMIVIWCVLMLSATAYAEATSPYTVEKVDVSADLRSDGSALITEEWTLTVAEDCKECFVREIVIIDDNFERITAVSDISVSLDGNTCSEETGDSLETGTYFYEKTDTSYSVMWYIPEAGTHTFAIRYIQSDAVKIYKDRAYFYYRAVNDADSMLCRNMTVTVNAPEKCYSEDFEIVESGTLAGSKADGSITFTAANTAGLVKIGITVPADMFNSSGLTVIVDDNRAETAVTVILVIVLVAASAYLIYFSFNYKKITLNRRLKKCRNKPLAEKIEKVQRKVFQSVSPATLLDAVLDGVINKSDYFTVTLLDLVKRGYIKADASGFTSSEKSELDICGRKLDENEKRVIRIFSSGRWAELVKSPKLFYAEIEDFNKNIKRISPFAEFTAKGKRLISYCFELRLSAKRFEFITPEEISDVFFKSGTYTVCDLVISLINEYDYAFEANFEKPSTENFRYNMFMFRDVYSEGEKIMLEAEQAKKQAKQKKKIGED
ncbi:MAG: DUF2207 domain-containing protein [Clostridia bacterium]|nr:DUF2207 domain-containing protein [Clostridia bacterium]